MSRNGALLVDKASDWTSHDVVAKLRGLLRERRIGHAGTLDPMATGLLVLALGPATRLLQYATAGTKHYTGVVRFGAATDSLDATGVVVATAPVPPLTTASVNARARSMWGPSQQVPPMVSALKVNGKKLYELAREGKEIERAPRDVVINEFSLAETDDPNEWTFSVRTSPGTYVRVLLADLAERLGTLGHLTALRREASGSSVVADARTLEEIAERLAAGIDVVLPARSLVAHLPSLVVDEAQVAMLRQGKFLPRASAATTTVALDNAGEVVAMLEGRGDDLWRPTVVLATSE